MKTLRDKRAEKRAKGLFPKPRKLRGPTEMARAIFKRQRADALKRGVDWEFELEDWVKWWEEKLGLHWRQKRGHRSGQYVMGRKGDKGSYRRGNVICITCNLNSRMGHYIRRKNKNFAHL